MGIQVHYIPQQILNSAATIIIFSGNYGKVQLAEKVILQNSISISYDKYVSRTPPVDSSGRSSQVSVPKRGCNSAYCVGLEAIVGVGLSDTVELFFREGYVLYF